MKILNLMAASALSIALATAALAQSTQPTPSNRATSPPTAISPTKPSTAPSSSATPAGLVDINSASKDELDKLNGIGPARAEAIVQNRPYKVKSDLKMRRIIAESTYEGIQDKIVA